MAGKYCASNFQKMAMNFTIPHALIMQRKYQRYYLRTTKKAGLVATNHAKLLDEINFMHPFREYSSRSCKVLLLAS